MSQDGKIDDLSYRIGGLTNAVETLTRTWAEQDRKASLGRKELYDVVGDMRIEIATMKQSIAPIATLQTDVDTLTTAKHQAQGAVWMARLLFGIAAGAIGAVLTRLIGGGK